MATREPAGWSDNLQTGVDIRGTSTSGTAVALKRQQAYFQGAGNPSLKFELPELRRSLNDGASRATTQIAFVTIGTVLTPRPLPGRA